MSELSDGLLKYTSHDNNDLYWDTLTPLEIARELDSTLEDEVFIMGSDYLEKHPEIGRLVIILREEDYKMKGELLKKGNEKLAEDFLNKNRIADYSKQHNLQFD